MSASRRAASDVNILAMLDGLGARPQAKRTVLWCGGAGLLACSLVGTVAWLAHDAAPVPASVPVPIMAAAEPPPTLVHPAQGLEPAPAPGRVSVAAAPALPVGGAATVKLAGAAPEPAPAPPDAALPFGPAPHAHAPPRQAPAAHAGGARHLGSRLPPEHSAGDRARALAAHVASRRARPGNRSLPQPAAVDTDVALISAIIEHASQQQAGAPHDAAGEGGCAGKVCGPRMPPQP